MVQILHLDSRKRQHNSTVSNAQFSLPRPIQRATRCRVKSVQFINTFHNITTHNNIISTNSGDIVLETKSWPADELVSEINLQLISGTVTIDEKTNILTWSIGSLIIDASSSSMADILGLTPSGLYTGNFQSRLFLAMPQYIAFSCDKFIGSNVSNVFPDQKDEYNFQPFIIIPVKSAFLEAQTYESNNNNDDIITLDTSRTGIDIQQLSVRILDPFTQRELNEITHWSMVIQFV